MKIQNHDAQFFRGSGFPEPTTGTKCPDCDSIHEREGDLCAPCEAEILVFNLDPDLRAAVKEEVNK